MGMEMRYLKCSLYLGILLGSAHCSPHSYKNEYASASATLYAYDSEGTAWILMGKENRHWDYSGVVWNNFGGKRDKTDRSELHTAQREAWEETARIISFRTNAIEPMPLYIIIQSKNFYLQTTKPVISHHVGYFLCIDYVDSETIRKAAQKLDHSAHVEKEEWRWIRATDLLNWAKTANPDDLHCPLVDAPLFDPYKKTLCNEYVQLHLHDIISAGKISTSTKG